MAYRNDSDNDDSGDQFDWGWAAVVKQ